MLNFSIEVSNNQNAKEIFPNLYKHIKDFIKDASTPKLRDEFEYNCAQLNAYVASVLQQAMIDTADSNLDDIRAFLDIKKALKPDVEDNTNYITFADGYYTGRFLETRLKFYMKKFTEKFFVNFVALVNSNAEYDDKDIYTILNKINQMQKTNLDKCDYFLSVPLVICSAYIGSLVNVKDIAEEDLSKLTLNQYAELLFALETLNQIKNGVIVNSIVNHLNLNA